MELKGPGSYIIVWNEVVPLWKTLLYLYFLWDLLSCLPYSHLWLTVALNSLCFSKPHTKITTWIFWVECRWNRRWRVIDVQGSLSFLHLVIFFLLYFKEEEVKIQIRCKCRMSVCGSCGDYGGGHRVAWGTTAPGWGFAFFTVSIRKCSFFVKHSEFINICLEHTFQNCSPQFDTEWFEWYSIKKIDFIEKLKGRADMPPK